MLTAVTVQPQHSIGSAAATGPRSKGAAKSQQALTFVQLSGGCMSLEQCEPTTEHGERQGLFIGTFEDSV